MAYQKGDYNAWYYEFPPDILRKFQKKYGFENWNDLTEEEKLDIYNAENEQEDRDE